MIFWWLQTNIFTRWFAAIFSHCYYIYSHTHESHILIIILVIDIYYFMHSFLAGAILLAFCAVSYLEVIKSRDDQVPTKGNFVAALLPLFCIPAVLSLRCGLLKWLVKLHYIFQFVFMLNWLNCCFVVWLVSHLFLNVLLLEGWWLETFSRWIYLCYNWPSAWCYTSFGSCS